jgi:hypothetical protein
VGLRQWSVGATVVQSFSEYVLGETNEAMVIQETHCIERLFSCGKKTGPGLKYFYSCFSVFSTDEDEYLRRISWMK